MIRFLLNRLKKKWVGPVVSLQVNNHTEILGKGQPKAIIKLKSAWILPRLLISPTMAFGEAYMKGDIIVEGDLMSLLRGYHESPLFLPRWWQVIVRILGKLPISMRRAKINARRHYDIGNNFYKLWLDPSMTYSCAYFINEQDSLEQAQQQKRELICRKIKLEAGQTLLDIGCGWGALMFHAAEVYGVKAVGITPAKEQAHYIKIEAKRRGLSDKIDVILGDWRKLAGQGKSWDRVVSVGMFEHVGRSHYKDFLKLWSELLNENGLSLLHTIGRDLPGPPDPWTRKYIFPGGNLPTLEEIIAPAAQAGLQIVDVENLWQHYSLTLQHWYKNFKTQEAAVRNMFDDNFVRMWQLYLNGSEAGFRYGGLELWQFVLEKNKSATWPLDRSRLAIKEKSS